MSFNRNNYNKHLNHSNIMNQYHQQQTKHYYNQYDNHYNNNDYEYNAYQQNYRYNNHTQANNHNNRSQNNNNNNNKPNKSFLNQQHRQHYRPQSRVPTEIISVKTETLINKKKKAKQPIFYDTETELAKACNNIEYNLENSMFENEEKQRLIHNKRCSLIKDYNLNKEECIDSDNNPITPNGSDNEDNNELENNSNQISFGTTNNIQIRNIWEQTTDFQMVNEDGINILHNDKDNYNEYGIYTLNGIKQQAMIAPNDIMIDGNDLINNAQIKYKSAKMNKKKKSPQNQKNKKIRRGGKNKNRNNNINTLSEQEIDELKAQKLANYLSVIRNQKF